AADRLVALPGARGGARGRPGEGLAAAGGLDGAAARQGGGRAGARRGPGQSTGAICKGGLGAWPPPRGGESAVGAGRRCAAGCTCEGTVRSMGEPLLVACRTPEAYTV